MLGASRVQPREYISVGGMTQSGTQITHLALTKEEAGKLASELMEALGIKLEGHSFELLQATFDRSQGEG